jgi:hypothetical protein
MTEKLSFKKIFPAGLLALLSIFILTTSWQRYQSHPLAPVGAELLPNFSLDHTYVTVVAKAMSSSESKQNFGHDLVSRGVQPLQLSIQNNTSNEYSLCPSSVDLPRIEPSKVAFKVTKGAIPRGIAYKIASFFFWPFMIPSTIDSIRVLSHHKHLKKDLMAKSMRDEVVAPYSTFHRVLFVPKDAFKQTFKVTLIELDSLESTEFNTTVQGALPVETPDQEILPAETPEEMQEIE